MKTILIAGGTGYIGSNLEQYLFRKGYDVKVLTRRPLKENHVFWNPGTGEIDLLKCRNVQVLINLCGEGIDRRRWTKKQKELLIASRVEITGRLFELRSAFPDLEHYVSASGITAYGFDDGTHEHTETDDYGTDFLSGLVEKWENAADLFRESVIVSKLRIAVVLEWNKGALKKMSAPLKSGFGAPLGSGKQQIPWVHISDLVRMFEFIISERLEGVYNTNAGNITNEDLTKAISKKLNKKLWLPNVPDFVLKLLLGQMAEMVLCGAKASNRKIGRAGFVFNKTSIEEAL